MERYGNLDALLENLKKQYGEELGWQHTVNMSDVGMMIEDAPTADVVPKSEVERLKVEGGILEQECGKLMGRVASLEIELEAMRSAANSYKMHYENLAREIFEEIEKIRLKEIHKCETLREQENEVSQRKYWEGGYNSLRQLSYWFDELKKKYTESNTND